MNRVRRDSLRFAVYTPEPKSTHVDQLKRNVNEHLPYAGVESRRAAALRPPGIVEASERLEPRLYLQRRLGQYESPSALLDPASIPAHLPRKCGRRAANHPS